MALSIEDELRELKTENEKLKGEVKRLSNQVDMAIRNAEIYSQKMKKIVDDIIGDVKSIKDSSEIE